MSERFGRASCSRGLILAALLPVLGACSGAGEDAPGYIEVTAHGACDDARRGQLRLDGASTTSVIAGAELCHGWLVRALSAGSYRLSWQDGAPGEESAAAPPPGRPPALLTVLAGRTTRVRVMLESAAPELSAELSEDEEPPDVGATCSALEG